PGVHSHNKKNRSFRPDARVLEEVTSRHPSDGGVNDRQSYNGPSLVLSGSGPFNIKVEEVAMDHQVSDNHHFGQHFKPFYLKGDGGPTNRQVSDSPSH
ncbi:hypothetical protein HAX54_034173, partial [Datura stramonium]|nr:hypothetical protein [Datura stramonium]